MKTLFEDIFTVCFAAVVLIAWLLFAFNVLPIVAPILLTGTFAMTEAAWRREQRYLSLSNESEEPTS